MKTINNYVVKGKNVLIRVDLNVPVLNGIITEKSRIDTIKPTIEKLLNQKNKIFLLSHFGRPEGQFSKKYSLEFICSTLQEEFETNRIHFLESFNDSDIKNKIHKMDFGEICLFENIRFHPGEESNDSNFIQEICKSFDVYVNDAFSASHRNHASIVGAPQYLPSLAGESLLEEIKNIDSFVNEPKKPNVAIIGGSKISTKIDLLHNLTEFFNTIVIGGGMANTFLNAQNIDIGNSLCEKDLSTTALSIMEKADNLNCKIVLPLDVVCADNINDQSSIRRCDIKNILPNQMVLDVGNKTSKIIAEIIDKMVLSEDFRETLYQQEYEFVKEITDPIKTAEWWDSLFEESIRKHSSINRKSSAISVKFRMLLFLIANRLYYKKLERIFISNKHHQ